MKRKATNGMEVMLRKRSEGVLPNESGECAVGRPEEGTIRWLEHLSGVAGVPGPCRERQR
jgi:hypothetical protein